MRFLALALLVAACGGASRPATAPTSDAPLADGPQKLVVQWRQAWEIRSPDALAALYSHGNDLIVVEQGERYAGWDQVATIFGARCAAATGIHLTLDDETVTTLGADAALVNATVTRELDDASGAVTERGSLTLVVTREGDHWVIVGEHYSHGTSVE